MKSILLFQRQTKKSSMPNCGTKASEAPDYFFPARKYHANPPTIWIHLQKMCILNVERVWANLFCTQLKLTTRLTRRSANHITAHQRLEFHGFLVNFNQVQKRPDIRGELKPVIQIFSTIKSLISTMANK